MVLLALAIQTKISFFVIAGALFAIALAFAIRSDQRMKARCPKLLELRERVQGVTRRFYSARFVTNRNPGDKHYRLANDLYHRASDLYSAEDYAEATKVAELGLAEMKAFYDSLPRK